MDTILGIDLGTTNSVVSLVQDGKAEVLRDERGQSVLRSIVGLDSDAQLLVGELARNQALVAPGRTVRSIKRKMGEDIQVPMGDETFSPQEISAFILRSLKQRAEQQLGHEVTKAVITVPAFFSENQRDATREAGSLAGLDVVRIINEPTAASLAYESGSERSERLMVYDLGGGTFDVSIVQVEDSVVEVLASHGDTQLGGDDFDDLLLNHVRQAFLEEHDIDLDELPTARSRLLRAVEEAKHRLSDEAFTAITEEFIAEREGKPLNLDIVIDRSEYEELILPLVEKTITSVDAALADAGLTSDQIDRVLLVGGSTRTPLVQQLLEEQLGHEPRLEVDPDLCVAMGAAIQAALIAGVDVGPVLVDITPRTLGIRCVGQLHGHMTDRVFARIIKRNTPLPAMRSEIYYTAVDGQEAATILVLQGEHEDATFNETVGEFTLEGLNENAGRESEILVRFELNLDGILTVTAVERDTGLERRLTLENPITKFRAASREDARARLSAMFDDPNSAAAPMPVAGDDTAADEFAAAVELIARARRQLPQAPDEDAEEMRSLVTKLDEAITLRRRDRVDSLTLELEDLLFYLEDA